MVSSVVSTEPGTVPCGRRVHVQVPATSANLGPGFDTLGLALARYDVLDIEVVPTGLEIEVHGVGEGLPPLRFVAHNTIPHGRGLGSSGAAIVAGVVAAQGLLTGITTFTSDDLLD